MLLSKNIKSGMIVAFGELFLKSKGVQEILKRRLINNLSHFLKKEKIDFRIHDWRERVFIETKDIKKTKIILKMVFGFSWFAESLFLERADFKTCNNFIKDNYQNWIKKNETFALRIKNGSKLIDQVAKNINRKVDLDNPQKTIFIENRKQGWFIYFKKQRGAGGFPVGSQGKILSLISGGIDSPVASYLMAKRGVQNVWLHFHSFPFVSKASIEKVKETAQVFLNYQPELKIYFIPFSEIQKKIKINIPAKYRVLFYRRLMLEMAQTIAKKEGYQALVTGESLGQVSSQTLANLQITQENITMPLLRPLIGMDKEEIINLAKKINTFDISIKPQEDCCTLFVPKGQTAAGNLEVMQKLSKGLKLKTLISKALKEMKIENF
ncbi:tRNA 4-thiouridine(8) synthase ThiI [Patescibacteria group bacterium]|nr:tRNA 4-thiouridine(8) synthase ThiI [Patescibacteria group bacterium]